MTELRDARLKRALDHAPDAHMTPDARTRGVIRALAAQALAPVAAPQATHLSHVPWWRRWAGRPGTGRMPWNAALATVLLAGLVTLVWREEDIPGARTGDQAMPAEAVPVAPRAAPSASRAAPTAPRAAPSAPPAAGAPPAAPARPATAPGAAGGADAAGVPAELDERTDARAKRSVAKESAKAGNSESTTKDALPPGRAAPAPPLPVPAMPAPQPAPAAEATPPPTAVARAAPRAPPPAPLRAGTDRFAPLTDWTQARVTVDGRTVVVERADADALASRISTLVMASRLPGALAGAEVARVELLASGGPVATVRIAQAGVEWTPANGAATSGAASPERVQELLAELRRLPGR